MTSRTDWHNVRRLAWLSATACLVALGLAAAVVFTNWSTLVTVFLLAGGFAGSCYLSVALTTERLNGRLLAEVLSWSGRAGTAIVAIWGFGAAIGPATLLLIGLVLATAPVAFLRSRTAARGEGAAAPDLTALTDEELCAAWQRSHAALWVSHRSDDVESVVDTRRRYLDELERRSPEAFATWLGTIPTATDNPSAFYIDSEGGQPDRG